MKKLSLLALTVVCLVGCYNDNKEDLTPDDPSVTCDSTNVTFSGSVLPILTENCATSGCHNSIAKAGTYDLSGYEGAKAASGRMVGAINHAAGFSPMPQGGNKLDDCKIAKIEKWVEAGAPNN